MRWSYLVTEKEKGPETILIVDDARFARRIETKALQDAGFEHIVEAKTAKEALKIFEEQAPELTLLDITLPDNSDLTLLRTMMKIRPEAKIVMNSAIGQELIIQDALKAGARDFITKPFKEKEFIEKIVKVMKGN
jgi:two-component system chemotaxis response regulator CheY